MLPFESRTFLMVEDSPDDRMLLGRAFTHAEIINPVVFKSDGQEAREYLEQTMSRPNENPIPMVMLTDLKMPRMDGFELMAWVQEQPPLKRMTVVVLSSSNVEADATRASELGAHFYLSKPSRFVDQVRMLRSLAEWLSLVRLP